MADWFSTWFDSPYYHLLYKHRDQNEAKFFIDRLVNHLSLTSGAKVADIPCGKGRHSIYLHQLGFDVTGIDLAPESIAYANTFATSGLHFEVGDMRTLSLAPEFDVVFNLFTSFGYFDSEEENIQAMKSLVQGVKSSGTFVMDFMNIQSVLNKLIPRESKTIEGVVFEISRKVENSILIKSIEVNDADKKFQFQERVKVLYLQDLERFLNLAGLKIVQVFGSYHLDQFDLESSDRVILIATR